MRSIVLLLFIAIVFSKPSLLDPSNDLVSQLNQLFDARTLRGLQIEITKSGQSIFYHNKGFKNEANQSIDSNTIFKIMSCSKSFSAVAIMQLVEQGKLKLNDTLSNVLGFEVKNPHFPEVPITVEMILSHQASIVEPDEEYGDFLTISLNATDGSSIPDLKQLMVPGGKFYNHSLYLSDRKPGSYFHYSNLGFVIAGTIIEKISGQRFDLYMKENILDVISQGLAENATFNIGTISNYKNLGASYVGKQGNWIARNDSYNGPLPSRNLTGYKIGSNGAVFSPQAGLRASVHHMNNYIHIYANKGVTKTGKRLLTQKSINQILKPRYQYHGSSGVSNLDMHLYGLGIFTTSYLKSDTIIEHQVVRAHLGASYGLISGYHFWKDYAFSYIINGALNGYIYDSTSIYEKERTTIHQSVDAFIQKLQQTQLKME